MDNAELLFSQLKKDKYSKIKSLIIDQQEENFIY